MFFWVLSDLGENLHVTLDQEVVGCNFANHRSCSCSTENRTSWTDEVMIHVSNVYFKDPNIFMHLFSATISKFWISSKSRSPIRFRKKMIHSWKNANATKTNSPMVIWVCTVPMLLHSWRLVMPRNVPKWLSKRLRPLMIRPKPALKSYATISMPLLRVQRRKNEWTAFKIVAVTTVKSIWHMIMIQYC